MHRVRKDAVARGGFKLRLGLTLKEARKQEGLKQEAVADALGIDNDTVSRWETAGRELRIYDLARLVHLYKVTGDVFLDPPERIDEIESAVRRSRSVRTALEAARASAAAEQSLPVGASAPTRPGKSRR